MPTLEGRIVGIEEKSSGYFRIETDTRPRFLDTKHEKLIDEAYRLLDAGSVEVLRYTEAESRNTNPNTGQPYINRYYEGAVTNGRERGGAAPEPPSRRSRPEPEPETRRESRPSTEPPTSFQNRTHPESAWRMALTSGSERAVQTLPLMSSEQRDFDTQKTIALAWARFIMDTPKPDERSAAAPGAYDEPDAPLAEEDEIPF